MPPVALFLAAGLLTTTVIPAGASPVGGGSGCAAYRAVSYWYVNCAGSIPHRVPDDSAAIIEIPAAALIAAAAWVLLRRRRRARRASAQRAVTGRGAPPPRLAPRRLAKPVASADAPPALAAPAHPSPASSKTGEAAADLAAQGGLGLVGAGAPAAARAILLCLLARTSDRAPAPGSPPAVIIPAADAATLLPGEDSSGTRALSVPATLEDALAEMETAVLGRARAAGAGGFPDAMPDTANRLPGLTLAATVNTPAAARRVAGILDSGHALGTAAVLLGDWPAAACQVTAGGLITSARQSAAPLLGGRLASGPALLAMTLRAAPAPPLPATPPVPGTRGDEDLAPAPPKPLARSARGRPVQLAILGPLRITAGGREVSGGLRKARELLAFLAVYQDGATGDAISEALWPGSGTRRADSQRNLALRKARSMLRAATGLPGPMWILHAAGRFRLDPDLIDTDLWQFTTALAEARRAATSKARLEACRHAAGLYRGELAEGSAYEWTEPHAEEARRRALDAWTAIAEILQPEDPGQALAALESALPHDPYNEFLYHKIMRMQAAAGRPEAARRTLSLLEARLAELGIRPSARTLHAAESLLGPAPSQPRPTRPG